MSSLRAHNVSKFYPTPKGKIKALENISLTINLGEFVVALGASGCGKSTLLGLLAGFIFPSQGQILCNEKPVTGPGRERAVVFQDDALFPWLSVLDNAAFGLHLQGLSKTDRQEQARKILDKVGLLAFENHSTSAISGGMRQRLGLARALAAHADFLLMDEPLGALDALTREQMQTLILHLWHGSGSGTFLITHSIEEALLMSTQLLILSPRPGRIIKTYAFDFSRRHAGGEPLRSIRADSEFIEARAALLDDILALT